jgi:hypothetical protein
LPYKLNALIGLRDDGEIGKEFYFKKICGLDVFVV